MIDSVKCFPKESDDGMTEYKRFLQPTTTLRYEQLKTQLQFRIDEGQGEAIYQLGIEDNGTISGASFVSIQESIKTLKQMAGELGYCARVIEEEQVSEHQFTAQVLIRREYQELLAFTETRIVVCGNVDAGKSTLVGVLTSGKLDDGRGSARQVCFNHPHEMQTGRTSSISKRIMGFSNEGRVPGTCHGSLEWFNIVKQSSRIVAFFDLAGHSTYLKTTIFGVCSSIPNLGMLVVAGNSINSTTPTLSPMTKEHIGIFISLGLKFFVVISKIDSTPRHILKQTMDVLNNILKGIKKMPVVIRNPKEAITSAQTMTGEGNIICPIFPVSSVTGVGISTLELFLELVKNEQKEKKEMIKDKQEPSELFINEVYSVAGIGTVVGGVVRQGAIHVGQYYLIGPLSDGGTMQIRVKSIHRHCHPDKEALSGQACTVAIHGIRRNEIRAGMRISDVMDYVRGSQRVVADIIILHHHTTITVGYCPILHCINVKAAVRIENIASIPENQQTLPNIPISKFNKIKLDDSDGPIEFLRSGDRGRVTLKFLGRPQVVRAGDRLVLREGHIRAVGTIVEA